MISDIGIYDIQYYECYIFLESHLLVVPVCHLQYSEGRLTTITSKQDQEKAEASRLKINTNALKFFAS